MALGLFLFHFTPIETAITIALLTSRGTELSPSRAKARPGGLSPHRVNWGQSKIKLFSNLRDDLAF